MKYLTVGKGKFLRTGDLWFRETREPFSILLKNGRVSVDLLSRGIYFEDKTINYGSNREVNRNGFGYCGFRKISK